MHSNHNPSIPPSPRIPQVLKRDSYVNYRFEALGTNKRARRESLCTTDPSSKDVSPLAQNTAAESFRQVGDQDPHNLRTLASQGAIMCDRNRPTPKIEWPTAVLAVETARSADQYIVVGSNNSDTTVSDAESQEGSSFRDENEPLDLLGIELSNNYPLLDLVFDPSTVEEATANARSTSEVWNFIQPHLRDLVRRQSSTSPPRFRLNFNHSPGEAPTDMVEVLAFNQILGFPYQRSLVGEWWAYVKTQYRTSRRRYHLVMAILTHVVGEQTCGTCHKTTKCTNCHKDGLPGCFTLPIQLMQPELTQVIGPACSNCIIRKKRESCDSHYHVTTRQPGTTTSGPQESEESQRSASVPASSDHTLPDEGSATPAPSSSRANNEIPPPADTDVLLPSPGENMAISPRLFGEVCEVANLFATFRTVLDQQEFIESTVEPLTTPGVNSVVMDAITPTLDLGQSEREKIVAVFQELIPMTPTKKHLLRLIALVYEQPAELQERIVSVVMNSLSLREDFHVGVQKAHEIMLLPEGDRNGLLSILLAFRTRDPEERAVPH